MLRKLTAAKRAELEELDDWHPVAADEVRVVFPDCRGSGRYVGLQAVEMCATCVGRGHVPESPGVLRRDAEGNIYATK